MIFRYGPIKRRVTVIEKREYGIVIDQSKVDGAIQVDCQDEKTTLIIGPTGIVIYRNGDHYKNVYFSPVKNGLVEKGE